MKIAIISDLHGNLTAVDAVLNDIKSEKCEKIFCLGDLAMAGGEPNEVINKIKTLENLTIIQGNTDEMIANCNDELVDKLKNMNEIMGNALEDDAKIITEENLEYLKNLDKQKSLTEKDVTILLVHGSPRKNNEDISPNLQIEKVEEMIKDTIESLIFCGHTHLPCGYQTNTKQTVVNVGSIGRPFTDNAKPCYVVLDIKENKEFEIRHKFVDYDNKKAAEIVSKRNYKGAEKLAKMLINPTERYPK